MLMSSAMGATKLVGVIIFMCIVDRYGRRRILISGAWAMGISMATLAIGISSGSASIVMISMMAYILSYANAK